MVRKGNSQKKSKKFELERLGKDRIGTLVRTITRVDNI